MVRIGHFWCHTYLQDRIRPTDTIFDFGFNYGGFSQVVAPFCRRVIGYEPNLFWNDQRPALPANVVVVNKAIAATRGIFSLHLDPNGGPRSSLHVVAATPDALTVDVEAVTLAEALAAEPLNRIGLIKLDIEGEELTVLQRVPAEALARVAQMTVEFEDFHDESAIQSVVRRMRELGFWVVKFSWTNYGDVLFVNKNWSRYRSFDVQS